MNPYNNTTQQAAQVQTDQVSQTDDLAKALAGVQDNMSFEPVGEPAASSMGGVPAVDNSAVPMQPVSEPVAQPVVAAQSEASDVVSTPSAVVDHTAPVSPAAPDLVTTPVDAAVPAATAAVEPAGNGDIEQIKIAALQELRPLMQHIDLSPEERFEKYLMMLRASDDPSLIQPTYEAAAGIASPKLKAQALLDVINEINYFTAQQLI
jgi:hypothetical protein